MPALLVLGSSFFLSLLLTPLAGHLGRCWGIVDRPQGRRGHRRPTPRLGGIALFGAFFAVALTVYLLAYVAEPPASPQIADDARRLRGVLLGILFAFALGLLDDRLDLPPGLQFLGQAAAALIAIAHIVFIERITNPLTGREVVFPLPVTIAFTLFWVMGMVNTVNWLDGLDGLAAGVGAIAALLFAAHAYQLAVQTGNVGQAIVALFPLALAGACLGFLPFNFHPARIFMGSGGAMTLGYGLATLSILAPAKIATALLVMGVPILDVAWLIVDRWRRGRSPARAGRDHLHYRLLDLGLSQRAIVLGYYAFSAGFGLLALLLPRGLYKLIALSLLWGVMAVVLLLLSNTPPAVPGARR